MLEMLQVRKERTAMETDLRGLVFQLEPLQDQQGQSLGLREQLDALKARLQHPDALQVRCGELVAQLSVSAARPRAACSPFSAA